MKWLRFEYQDRVENATLEGDVVCPVEGSPFGTWRHTGERVPLDAVRLLPPVIPGVFYAAGLNYAGHVEEMSSRPGGAKVALPTEVHVAYRANNALIGAGEPIVIPASSSGRVQYEAELVAVIGRTARRVSEAEALSYVLGYTIGNDVSERKWHATRRSGVPRTATPLRRWGPGSRPKSILTRWSPRCG